MRERYRLSWRSAASKSSQADTFTYLKRDLFQSCCLILFKPLTINNRRNLANKDTGRDGVSDPICVLYGAKSKKPELGPQAELGRTEFRTNNASPTFKKRIALKYVLGGHSNQPLLFKIFDTDVYNSKGEVTNAMTHDTGHSE